MAMACRAARKYAKARIRSKPPSSAASRIRETSSAFSGASAGRYFTMLFSPRETSNQSPTASASSMPCRRTCSPSAKRLGRSAMAEPRSTMAWARTGLASAASASSMARSAQRMASSGRSLSM